MIKLHIDVTLEKIEELGKVPFSESISNNFLKANADKCNLIFSADEPFLINTDNEVIKNSNNKKLFGINLDNNRLGFDTHVTNICNQASKKLHVLARISQFMRIHEWRMTMIAFIVSEFGFSHWYGCSIVGN